ncbi:MAG: hypothetical protein AAFU60_09455, partial [Bacteroidota bacterium]
MKRFALFLVFACSWSMVQAQTWHEYVQEDGSFRILFPQEPSIVMDTIETDIGAIIQQSIVYQETDTTVGSPTYLVNIWEYPEATVHSDSTELVQELFEATIEASVEELDGILRYQTPVEDTGYPGLLWRVDYLEESATLKTEAIVVNNRLYALQVACLRVHNQDASINR